MTPSWSQLPCGTGGRAHDARGQASSVQEVLTRVSARCYPYMKHESPFNFVRANAPRDARGQKTRPKLLRAAEVIFGEKGYERASIADITRKSGVALGTFYVYFPDKQSIFVEVVDELGERLRRLIAESVSGFDHRIDVEREGLRAFFEFAREHPNLYRVVRQAEFVDEACYRRYYDRFAKGYVRGLTQAMEGGEIRTMDPEVLAYCLMGIGDFLGMRWIVWRRIRAWSACWTPPWRSSATGWIRAGAPRGQGRREGRQQGHSSFRSARRPSRAQHPSEHDMRYAQILSTGRYVPEKVITNADMDTHPGRAGGRLARAERGHPRAARDGGRPGHLATWRGRRARGARSARACAPTSSTS